MNHREDPCHVATALIWMLEVISWNIVSLFLQTFLTSKLVSCSIASSPINTSWASLHVFALEPGEYLVSQQKASIPSQSTYKPTYPISSLIRCSSAKLLHVQSIFSFPMSPLHRAQWRHVSSHRGRGDCGGWVRCQSRRSRRLHGFCNCWVLL